ncbi:monovalent cation/H+ antiporter subunit A [Salinibius halmophilus]|uniref:monovalent cation/H+ antiporter subunit A n=1 Tax=Salinibius halmophilus TaxID=1853216 RepID=UPI000E67277C|nr:monovalent cation/H+ antiporter subunit A [Salinibius halmophilus]
MNIAWIIVLPLLGVIAPLLANPTRRNQVAWITAVLPFAALLITLYHAPAILAGEVVQQTWYWIPQIGLTLSFRMDGLALLFTLLILGIGLLIILYARYYLSSKDPMGRFYSYLILFMAAMLGIVNSGNLLQMWAFWELTSISSFLLIGFWSSTGKARKGARMALTITGAGGLALLAGILLIGKVVGSLELEAVLNSGRLLVEHQWYPVILALVLIGAFTKSAQFPFHFWLPHAMSAPTPVSAYLHSATMVKAGIFLLARMFPVLSGHDAWFVTVSLVGLATLLLGAYTALFKHDLKGLLAYSTISHLGLITLLLGMGTELAAVAALFHIVNHAVFKASLFMGVGIIDHETGTRDMRQINGLFKYMPHTAVLCIVAALSMAGVPLLNGFLSKEMFFAETLEQSAIGALSWLIPLLATIAGALSVAYSLRFIHDVFFNGEPKGLKKTPHEPPRYMRIPVEVLVALCILVGIFPALLVGDLLKSAGVAVLGGTLPYIPLYIWHGFNLPLLMSALALAGGIGIYARRKVLFQFQSHFKEVDANERFDAWLYQVITFIRRIEALIDKRSLQYYLAWLSVALLILLAAPLLNLSLVGDNVVITPLTAEVWAGTALIAIAALATVVNNRRRLFAALLISIVGLGVSLAFARFSAPDLALTQISVEVITTILLLLALFFLPQTTPKESKPGRLLRDIGLAGIFGGIMATLTYAMLTRPIETISDYFLANSKTGGGGTNVVNVILVDFRGFDTFGEITVLGIAALGIYKLTAGMRLFLPATNEDGLPWSRDKYPLILKQVSQSILPLALLISAYIFLRGHNLPGGGFIAGLITAIAIVQQYIGHGNDWIQKRFYANYVGFIAAGLSIALLTGLGSWLWQKPFLTSWFDYFTWPVFGKFELASAMLFDLGVYLTVVGAAMLILAKLGQLTVVEPYSEKED